MSDSKRNTKIELLRIIAMLFIIIGHALGHGGLLNAVSENGQGVLFYILKFINIVDTPAVNIFVIISGYFGIQSKFSVKRVLLLWLQVFFYSIAIFGIMTVVGVNSFSLSGLVKAVFPVSFNQYWFFTVFIGLTIFAPFLNIVLLKLSNAGFQYLFGLCFVLFTLTGSIPGIYSYNPQAGNGILWFFILYSVGAYLRKYQPKHRAGTYFGAATICYIISFISFIVLKYVSNRLGFAGMGCDRLGTYETFPIYFASIATVSMVLKCAEKDFRNEKLRKVILYFSSSVFGVYMIHENPIVRSWLWKTINLSAFSTTPIAIVILAAVAMTIFVIATIIDKFTWNQIKKLLLKIDTKKIDEKINTWLS